MKQLLQFYYITFYSVNLVFSIKKLNVVAGSGREYKRLWLVVFQIIVLYHRHERVENEIFKFCFSESTLKPFLNLHFRQSLDQHCFDKTIYRIASRQHTDDFYSVKGS